MATPDTYDHHIVGLELSGAVLHDLARLAMLQGLTLEEAVAHVLRRWSNVNDYRSPLDNTDFGYSGN